MCQPVTASMAPASINRAMSLATVSGGRLPSTGMSRTGLPSSPVVVFRSAIASCAQASQDGP